RDRAEAEAQQEDERDDLETRAAAQRVLREGVSAADQSGAEPRQRADGRADEAGARLDWQRNSFGDGKRRKERAIVCDGDEGGACAEKVKEGQRLRADGRQSDDIEV